MGHAHWDAAHLAGIDTRTNTTTPTDPNSTSSIGVWAPLGRYTLTTHADPAVDPAHTDITIAGDHHDLPIELTPTIRPDIHTRIDQQIRARIDQCAGEPDPNPIVGQNPLDTIHSCPLATDITYTITDSPHWTIHRYPTIALHMNDDGSISVATTAPGEATFDFRWSLTFVAPERWDNATVTTPITIGGHVVLDHDNPTWTPQ